MKKSPDMPCERELFGAQRREMQNKIPYIRIKNPSRCFAIGRDFLRVFGEKTLYVYFSLFGSVTSITVPASEQSSTRTEPP